MNPPTPIHNPFKMSISDATLIIGFSRPEYDPIFVKRTFDTIFGDGFVEYVTEQVFNIPGRPKFKKFYLFIHDQDHPALKRITDLIAIYKFAKIGYKNEWDRATRKYVDRYWKVYDTPKRPVFHPYLMTESQMSVQIEPWSPEADAAFEWQQIGKDCGCTACLREDDLEAAMPRITYDKDADDDIEACRPKNEGPYKMVRAVNMAATQTDQAEDPKDDTYWSDYWKLEGPPKLVRQTNKMAPTEDEYDTAQDFADLEAAVEKYGEDYPGSIAPKIPRPPTESEEWDGLAKSLDEFMEKLPQVEWFDLVSGN